jgi:hypothetical protein
MPCRIEIDLRRQRLYCIEAGVPDFECAVSTARNGPGEIMNSYCTPRGHHAIARKIGAGLPPAAVFERRVWQGAVWSPAYAATEPPTRDWILTRILWLSGCEPGHNRLGDVDTMRRYIYIHGSHEFAQMGKPGSIGCVRMRNADIIELFDLIPCYIPVQISDA